MIAVTNGLALPFNIFGKNITRTAYSFNQLWLTDVIAQAFAQSTNLHINAAIIEYRLFTTDQLQQLITAHHTILDNSDMGFYAVKTKPGLGSYLTGLIIHITSSYCYCIRRTA